MAKKKVLVACGTGIATSTVVVNKVKEVLKDRGVEAEVQQCKVSEVASKAAWADLIITTTQLPNGVNAGKPVVRSLAFLTGIGIEKDVAEIMQKLGVES